MYPIRFTKQRAVELLDAIANGRSLPAPPGGWTISELAQAAGALFTAALSHGPPSRWDDKEKFEGLHYEHQELQEERLYDDLHAVIQYHSELHFAVQDGEYDGSFEEEVTAIIEHDSETQATKVRPLAGFKSQN